MAQEAFVSQFDLVIGGQPAPPELMRAVTEFIVDDSLYLPDMFTLRIHDGNLQWVDSDLLTVGVEIQIQATAASHGTQSGATDELI